MAGIITLFVVAWIVFGAIFFFGLLKPETTDDFNSNARLLVAVLIGGPIVIIYIISIGIEGLLFSIFNQHNRERLRSFFIKE